jgi:hypothetical protein
MRVLTVIGFAIMLFSISSQLDKIETRLINMQHKVFVP